MVQLSCMIRGGSEFPGQSFYDQVVRANVKWLSSKRLWALLSGLFLSIGFLIFGQITATDRFYDFKQVGDPAYYPPSSIVVSEPVTPGLSPVVEEIQFTAADPSLDREVNPRHDPLRFDRPLPSESDTTQQIPDPFLSGPLVQNGQSPPVTRSFEGTAACPSCRPADPVGDVGPEHYVSMANFHISIFSKQGELLTGPVPFEALFAPQGGHCGTQNAGDPIVVYDGLADRWLLSQFAAPHHLCVAVSTGANPADTYYTYEFDTLQFPDYFKFGVWDDGYYMSANERFYTAYAFEKAAMTAGQPARYQKYAGGSNFLMPADHDGLRPPIDNSPHLFYTFKNGTFHGGEDRLELFHFAADWDDPENSDFSISQTLALTPFTYTPCGYFVLNCIPQRESSQRLDSIAEWPMFRLAYRSLPDREKMVGAFTVGGGSGEAGAAVRWFELTRRANDTWTLSQEGTHDQRDGVDRFNPSIAMDRNGSIALGYSASSRTIYPEIRYAVHDIFDPPGTMRRETIMQRGFGAQWGSNRWGDYSAMSIDPIDGCTFFYTNQYYPAQNAQWKVQVGTFELTSCTTPDMLLDASPPAQTACVGQTADFEVSATRLAGFSEEIVLSAEGLPSDAQIAFSGWRTNTDPQVNQSTLTIQNLVEGGYEFSVIGLAQSVSRSVPLSLRVLPGLDQAAELMTPNWAEFTAAGVVLQWQPNPQASFYHLQVAADDQFDEIVFENDRLRTTEFQLPRSLPTNSPYYWRVMAMNNCGPGPISEVRAFVTAAAIGECPLGTTATTILNEPFENGLNGWQKSGLKPTWHTQLSSAAQGRFATAEGADFLADQQLVSVPLQLDKNAVSAALMFHHQGNIEGNSAFDICWDAGMVELSTDLGASWESLDEHFLSGGYDGEVSDNYGNPAAGAMGWCGSRPTWEKSVVDLTRFIGQDVQLRYRLASDRSITFGDWSIDDVTVRSCRPDLSFGNGAQTDVTGKPGETIVLDVPLQRIAPSDETYAVDYESDWIVSLGNGGLLDFQESTEAHIPLNIMVPADAQNGQSQTTWLTVSSQKIPTISFTHKVVVQVEDLKNPAVQYRYFPIVGVSNVPALPNLIIENVVVAADGLQFDVVNGGLEDVTDPFWVDGYLNPFKIPAGVNDTHDLVAPNGIAWGINDADLPMSPGDRITLHLLSDQLDDDRSNFKLPLKIGTVVYIQVDSANLQSSFGGVLERHEAAGGPYDNIVGPFVVGSGSQP